MTNLPNELVLRLYRAEKSLQPQLRLMHWQLRALARAFNEENTFGKQECNNEAHSHGRASNAPISVKRCTAKSR